MPLFRFHWRKFLLIIISTVLITISFYFYTIQPGASITIDSICPRPAAGSVVEDPEEIASSSNLLQVNLTVDKGATPNRLCYRYNGKVQAPTIRIKPGDTVVWKLKNRSTASTNPPKMVVKCTGAMPSTKSPPFANLHFHGLNMSPACGQDNSVATVIKPNEQFEYKLQIPKNEPPGMYWYHPHIHTQSEGQLLAGLSGAIIVEGIEQYNNQVKGLEERVFVIRDAKLSKIFPDTDTNQPAKDTSINYVPINYQGNNTYSPPAIIDMNSAVGKKKSQFWRVVNASADNYANLQVQYNGVPQTLGLVAMDGIAVDGDNTKRKNQTIPKKQIALPPGGRAEFIVKPPTSRVKAELLTLNFDTNGDNNPQRTLAKIITSRNAGITNRTAQKVKELPSVATDSTRTRFMNLDRRTPSRTRTLIFSQKENTTVTPIFREFYLTEKGKPIRVFDMMRALKTPDIMVKQGTVEDWIVKNEAEEDHVFHIHQIHFKVMASPDLQEQGMLRDTINIPAWTKEAKAKGLKPPQVRLRMDFGEPNIAGTFLYHCHILEHEDNGMMGSIRVT